MSSAIGLLALGRTARHNSTKMESHEAGTMPQFGGRLWPSL